MNKLSMESSKILMAFDEDRIKMADSGREIMSIEKPRKINKRFGILEGQYPDISIEELNWCNDEISEMFAGDELL